MARPRRRPPPPAGLLAASGLTKSYGDTVALRPLDLSVEAGQVVALIGHNGSGKSTLLRLAAGLSDPSDGTVTIGGHPAGSLEARARVAYVPDTPVLYDDLSVWEQLEYVARLRGCSDWVERGSDLIERFGLAGRADSLPSGFSRGLRQKAALVLGLVHASHLLLVDEPFVGLDTTGRAALVAVIGERAAAGTTVVVATHELGLLQSVDRCLALRDGAVVHDGPIEPAEAATLAG